MNSPTVIWMATTPNAKAMTRVEKMGAPRMNRTRSLMPVAGWVVAAVVCLVSWLPNGPHA